MEPEHAPAKASTTASGHHADTTPALDTTTTAVAGFTVGHGADAMEADADHRADLALSRLRLMTGTEGLQRHSDVGTVRRSADSTGAAPAGTVGFDGGTLDAHNSAQIDHQRSSGTPLTGLTRERMETAFGTSLSTVRVHADNNAARLSQTVSAAAFTTGQDIFFGKARYNPETPSGEHLLAHEIAHTLQRDSRVSRLFEAPAVAPKQATTGLRSRLIIRRDREEMQKRFSVRKDNKWKEFIDGKDQSQGPGAYERGNGGFYESMLLADAKTQATLGNRMNPEEYKDIHDLAVYHEPHNKGWRKGRGSGIQWGLTERGQTPSTKERENLEGHGLRVSKESEEEGGRHMVGVPETDDIAKNVEVIFDRYYDGLGGLKETESDDERESRILSLIGAAYQSLEALHAFKDGTSRTNHLVLNRLLVENGWYPVVLHAPNSPQFSADEWVTELRLALKRTLTEVRDGKPDEVKPQWQDKVKAQSTVVLLHEMIKSPGFLVPDEKYDGRSALTPMGRAAVMTNNGPPSANASSASESSASTSNSEKEKSTDETKESTKRPQAQIHGTAADIAKAINAAAKKDEERYANQSSEWSWKKWSNLGVTGDNAGAIGAILLDEYNWDMDLT